MDIGNWMRKTSKGFYSMTNVAVWIGCVALTAIILIVFVDVLGRYFLNKPLPGSYELVEQLMGVLAGFAIMYAAVKRGHVALDLIVSRFSRRTQAIMGSIFSLLGFGTWAVLAYKVYQHALKALETGITTDVLPIKLRQILLTLAVGTFLCSLILLIQAFRPEFPEEKVKEIEADL